MCPAGGRVLHRGRVLPGVGRGPTGARRPGGDRVRILHTSDWHLGHTLHDLPRDREHQACLGWLLT